MQNETAGTGQSWDLNPNSKSSVFPQHYAAYCVNAIIIIIFLLKEEKILTVTFSNHYQSELFGN